jgi:hypothetical protein
MKTYILIIINLFTVTVLSQEVKTPPEKRTKGIYTIETVRRGDKSAMLLPSGNSEKIKYKIEIKRETAFFSLIAEKIENGVFISEDLFDKIERERKVRKGDKISFEMIPDISDSSKMILFTNFPDRTHFRHFEGAVNKRIKYRKFKEVDNAERDTVPLILCYIDDKYAHTEKLLNKYSEGDFITLTAEDELQEKILKNVEKCMLIYYRLTEK